jgi:hypothetical protein
VASDAGGSRDGTEQPAGSDRVKLNRRSVRANASGKTAAQQYENAHMDPSSFLERLKTTLVKNLPEIKKSNF